MLVRRKVLTVAEKSKTSHKKKSASDERRPKSQTPFTQRE